MTFDTTTPEGVNAPVTKKPVTGYVFPFFHPSAKDSAVCTPPVAPAIWTLPHEIPAIRAQTATGRPLGSKEFVAVCSDP
jgi:hypothetical protein